MKPVRIIGGGIAGLALGIALRQKSIPVTVLEAGDYPRHKVCGEFLAGLKSTTIEILGLSGIFAEALQLESTRWYNGDQSVMQAVLPGKALGLSRYHMDACMAARLVELGGELRTRTRVQGSPETREGELMATGRRPSRESDWLGLKCHLRGFRLESDLELHIGEGCYLGISRIEGNRVNLCGLFRRRRALRAKPPDLQRAYIRACGLQELSERLQHAETVAGSQCSVSALSYASGKSVTGSLGDQYAMIPPFSGNGMTMALESAECALEPLTRYCRGELEWRATLNTIQEMLIKRFCLRLRSARLMHPFFCNSHLRGLLVRGARSGLLPFNLLYRLTH